MISLGCFDANIPDSVCKAYLKQVEVITRVPFVEVAQGRDKLALEKHVPDAQQSMPVAAVQQGLKSIGFFPGGTIDGICGYRTSSAIRLFQEYVRSVEKLECVPDGRFGPSSQRHLMRWMEKRLVSEWAPAIERWQTGTLGQTEYTEWLALLGRAKDHYVANPNRMLKLVDSFTGATDSRKVAQWDFTPGGNIHLIGIRRSEMTGKFDDIFVLLMKGLVFKFQGSTEPGASKDARGLPFLVQGQHDYHFGWHQRTYLALRPQNKGVLVVRSKDDKRLDDADLNNGLEANASINIHWGGRGMTRDVNSWSEGCQVINGTVYLNAKGELIDCSTFAALNDAEMAGNPEKTRGAYNVLVDLVTALSSDLPTSSVKYTLLIEQDLDLGPALKQGLADARIRVRKLLP